MSATFAAAEVRLGRATHARLANCSVRINGGEPVSAMFSNASVTAPLGNAGVYARTPRLSLPAALVEAVEEGMSVEIDSEAASAALYTVKARMPDELHTGMAMLLLEPAVPAA